MGWLNNLADVLSGRVNNTIRALVKRTNSQARTIRRLSEENIYIMSEQTANERKLVEIANTLVGVADTFTAFRDATQRRIAELEAQIGIPHEDLSQEFGQLDGAVDQLKAVAASLIPEEPTEPTDPVEPTDPTDPTEPVEEN